MVAGGAAIYRASISPTELDGDEPQSEAVEVQDEDEDSSDDDDDTPDDDEYEVLRLDAPRSG